MILTYDHVDNIDILKIIQYINNSNNGEGIDIKTTAI